MKKLIAGNWKMNLVADGVDRLAQQLTEKIAQQQLADVEFLVCPPSLWLERVKNSAQSASISLGGQDCHEQEKGAYTGDISATMLKSMGCNYVILGHSERRHGHHQETNDLIKQKIQAVHQSGLIAILCVGETLQERQAGQAIEVVKKQISDCLPSDSSSANIVIAYEPVWAIGTGEVATPEDIATMHDAIRNHLTQDHEVVSEARLIYGGSVKPENAQSVLATPNVDGVLVGGASLSADSFIAIGRAV